MRAIHNSRRKDFRSPFGAVVLGTTVTLRIDVQDDPAATCELRTWHELDGETIVSMEPVDGCTLPGGQRFAVDVEPAHLGNLWYSFIITSSDGEVFHYGAREGRTGGEGQFSYGEPPSFQITVYHERAHRPDWYRHGLVYQIFPDRFKRGEGWREQADRALARPRHGVSRAIVEDWDTPPRYARDTKGRVTRWDFYGGNLQGIREELPRLAELGVTAIYLNPIFEAASNHRYDTADYFAIDPLLGTEQDFKDLIADGKTYGIDFILDGVFNHTGVDSRYFNKFDNYEDLGAWQSADSPYRIWYQLDEDGTYGSWWGVEDLPAMDKNSPGWQSFIAGDGGVIEHWTSRGVRGWRLDVADELTDSFIASIKKAETAVTPDALLLGEVWEDASNKIAYGQMRHYLNGDELDSVMNYPFREAILLFLTGKINAEDVVEQMETLHENYPPDAFYEALNLLGSHDRARLFTRLGGAPDPDTLTDEQRFNYRLDDNQKGLAKGRLWMAVLLQMCSPGVPCIYYGDEAGMEGYADPYNRGPYPWGHEDGDCLTMHRNAIRLRKSFDFLVDGGFEPVSFGPDVYGFWRIGEHESACVLVNRSFGNTVKVRLPKRGSLVDEVISGRQLTDLGDEVEFDLYPFGSAFVYFHEGGTLAAPLEEGSGVLCHITSLPGEGGRPGTLGASAKRFVDYLAASGQQYWQVLPVTPADSYGSPYAGCSAFAGNVDLIDTGGRGLEELFAEFVPDEAFASFVEAKRGWLEPYAAYKALKDYFGPEVTWQEWPAEMRPYHPEILADERLAERIRFHEFTQYLFQVQWDDLHRYANSRGIKIIGDMPMYVSEDSVDTWGHPEFFRLQADGHAAEIAGTPPDRFAADGQIWGNPTYDWASLKKSDYSWWIHRLGRAFALYDVVRLDHFIGFESFYSIAHDKSAREGVYLSGPGKELFDVARETFGPLPLIVEDLGSITPAIQALVARCGFPSMDVIEFLDGDVRYGFTPRRNSLLYTSTHDTDTLLGWVTKTFYPDALLPVATEDTQDDAARSREDSGCSCADVACTAESDSCDIEVADDVSDEGGEGLTTGIAVEFSDESGSGSCGERGKGSHGENGEDGENENENRELVARKVRARTEAKETTAHLIAAASASPAPVVIIQLQDVLGLGSGARMNLPGTAEGNWTWQATWDEIDAAEPPRRRDPAAR